MADEYLFAENANMVISHMNEFIDFERNELVKEHDLHTRLTSLDLIFQHLDEEVISEGMKNLHKLITEIIDLLVEINNLLEEHRLTNLRIERDERKDLNKLKEDIKHKNWRIVKKEVKKEKKDEQKSLQINIRELRKLHVKFKVLKKLIGNSHLRSVLEKDLHKTTLRDFERREDYYFTQLYKIINFYEDLFFHSIQKEIVLFNMIRREN